MIALSMVDKVGPVLAKYLVSYCGGVEEVFESSEKELSKIPNIGPATIKKLKDKSIFDKADKQLEFIANKGITGHTFLDDTYPRRLKNLIAAMSDAVIVIESARKGGSIITAEFANQFNKDVFAVPGRTSDEYSEGCNKLIKQHKAHLLESAADIAYIMRWEEIDQQKNVQTALFVELDDQEQKVVDLLKAHPEINIDELNYKLQLTSSSLAAVMINLEFKGVIKCLPGKKYIVI